MKLWHKVNSDTDKNIGPVGKEPQPRDVRDIRWTAQAEHLRRWIERQQSCQANGRR